MEVKNLIFGAGAALAVGFVFTKSTEHQDVGLGGIGMIPVVIGGMGLASYWAGGSEGVLGGVIASAIAYSIRNKQTQTQVAAMAAQTAVYAQAANSCPQGSGWLTCVNQKMQAAGYPPVQSVNGVVAG